jgi:predicted P-loop ATPase
MSKVKDLELYIAKDLLAMGFNFRVNDLNEVIHVKFGDGDWQQMSDIIEARINLKMRGIGYGSKNGKKPGITALREAIMVIADRNRYNPIKDYFLSLEGKYHPNSDGPYFNHQFSRYFVNPDEQFEDWCFKWKVGAVGRALDGERNPMLVMVGPQDKGKSYACEWLCPIPGFYLQSSINNPDDKDNKVLVVETFIWEAAELESTISRSEIGALKAFITNRFIKVRPPYGRRPIHKPVPASFIGTVNYNGAGFLNDPSGSTRFLSCEVTHIDFDYSKVCNVHEQWAEAYWYYKNMPNSWKLTDDQRAKRDEINEKFEIVTGLEIAIEENFTITKAESDFIHTSEIHRLLVSTGFRIGNENAFPSSLGSVLTKKGLKSARRRLNDKNLRGWVGLTADVKSTKLD